MSQENKYIDPIVQEKLLQAEVSPPAAVWNGIEKTLAMKKKAAIVLLYRRVGYAAAILLFGFLSFYFISSEFVFSPAENKFAKQTGKDSLIKDAVSMKLTNEAVLAKKLVEEKEIDSNQKLANNKEVEATSNAGREIPIKSKVKEDSFIILRTIESHVEVEPEALASLESMLPNEVKSLYKSRVNAIGLMKASVYKRALKYEAATGLLAEHISKTGTKGWSVGLAYSPTSVSRFSGFSTKDYGALYADAGNELSSFASIVSEKDLPAYSGGVNVEYQLSERWSFQSGIYYLKQGQRIENFGVVQNELNASNSSNSYFGNINFDNIEALNESASLNDYVQVSDAISLSYFNADLVQQFNLLEIPLLVSYKIINRKTVLSVMSGINPGILVGNRVYLSDDLSNSVGKTESMNTLIYKSVLGVSIEYPLWRKLYISISPKFKYQLNNFNRNAITDEHLQYFEFKTGLNYRF